VKPKLILIVDDEPAILMTAAAILELQGYQTVTATDGATALQCALEFKPDLVLTDVVMPRMNGVQLAIELKDKLPSTAVLLFSGNIATADILETAKGQGHEFSILAKPVPMEELLAAVKNSLPAQPARAS
jgi:CheY-like chemotaxis protein